MKLGQLIEYDMRNIFLEKLYTKFDGETISRSISKKSKLSMSLGQYFIQYFFVSIVCQVEGY